MARLKYFNQTTGKWEYADEVYAKGPKGDPGFTPTITLTREEGGVRITATNEGGETSETVYDGTDGDPGNDGKTPVRGTDYWTDADKAEIKAYVDDAILNGAW